MKTQPDKTIPAIIIIYGLIFIFPILINLNSKLTTFAILWTSCWTLLILFGLWKIEAFEIKEHKLIKTNFLGLFKHTIDMASIIRYDKKVIDTDHIKNPLNVVKLFSKDKKYLIFREVTLTTENSAKVKLDERTINTKDFDAIFNKIKGIKNRQKS